MSDNTLFLNTLLNGFEENTPDPFFSRQTDTMSVQVRYNVVVRKMQSFSIATGDAPFEFTPPNIALADWDVIIVKVIGSATLLTTGKDTNGTTTINGSLDGYGTSIYPGYIILSSYNLNNMYLSGSATGQIFYCKSEEDS